MQKFVKISGIAASLPMINIDTDRIIPKQFLKTIQRTGLGQYLFYDLRFTPQGKEIPDFVLNQTPYRQASILLAGENFGCGSSREHAPWAFLDFGIRCIIAPSFADIFYNNCFKNGVLPIVLPQGDVHQLMDAAKQPNETLTVDLENQTVTVNSGKNCFNFTVDAFRRHCLLNGLDDIGLTLEHTSDIARYEAILKIEKPWLFA